MAYSRVMSPWATSHVIGWKQQEVTKWIAVEIDIVLSGFIRGQKG